MPWNLNPTTAAAPKYQQPHDVNYKQLNTTSTLLCVLFSLTQAVWTRCSATCFYCSNCWTRSFSLNTTKGNLVKPHQSHTIAILPSWSWVARFPPMEPTNTHPSKEPTIFCIISFIEVSNIHIVSQNLDSYFQHLLHSFQSSLHLFAHHWIPWSIPISSRHSQFQDLNFATSWLIYMAPELIEFTQQ